MKKVLRGALVAGVAFAACVGFGTSASAVEADQAEVPGITEIPEVTGADIDILNNACVLPWFWQGPINFLVEYQDGSYVACAGVSAQEAEGTSIGNNACILPWFWQGPFNILLGSQYGEYEACTAAGEVINDVEGVEILEDAHLPEDLKDQILDQLSL